MISVRQYEPTDREVWDTFVNQSKTPMFMFNRDFMEYHADRYEDESLMFFKDEKLIAVMPVSRHGNELRSHGGLTYGGIISGAKMRQITMLECFAALKNYVLTQGGGGGILYKAIPHFYHIQPAEEDLYALFRNNAQLEKVEPSVVVNLKNPLKMMKRRKCQIARAKREGVEVHETDDLDAFINLVNATLMAHHGVKAVHTADEMRLLRSRFPENIRCFGAFRNGRLIAGALLFVYPKVIHAQYLCADSEAREIGGLDLVIAHILELFQPTHEWLDFGISTENAGRILNEGLIEQKEGFGGRVVAYTTWRIPIIP